LGYILLDKVAFNNNIEFYSKFLGSKDKICLVLKDNAYGHGIELIASLASSIGIKHTLVRDIYEAQLIEKYNFSSILVLYEIPTKKYPNNYIFAINSLDDIKKFPKNTKVELKIDTGMSRNGITLNEIKEAIQQIEQNDLILNGVFTHFCCSGENDNITFEQEKKFLKAIKEIKQITKTSFRIHCTNTDSVNIINNDLYDIARIGIGIYGYNKIQQQYLKPVMSLWANKISTRILNKGDKIGYGATYTIDKDNVKVSNYDIGYANGLFRVNERKKFKIQNGKKILGRISMDSFSVFGDDEEVCVFNNATSLAKAFDTIEYEIFTHLKDNIKRKYEKKD